MQAIIVISLIVVLFLINRWDAKPPEREETDLDEVAGKNKGDLRRSEP